jgi:hypothetical protein
MTCALPAVLDLGHSTPLQTVAAPRAARLSGVQDAEAGESFGKILDDKRGSETDSTSRPPEKSPVRQSKTEARRAAGERDEQQWAPSTAASAQTADPLAEPLTSEFSQDSGEMHGADDSAPARTATADEIPNTLPEPECSGETMQPEHPARFDSTPQMTEGSGTIPSVQGQTASAQIVHVTPNGESFTAATAAELVNQFVRRTDVRAPASREAASSRQPLMSTPESGNRNQEPSAIEGILKPSRVDFQPQELAQTAPDTTASPDVKAHPQSVRRVVGEIHAMVGPETEDSAPVRFSELPTTINDFSSTRPGTRSPDLSPTPRLAAPTDTASLRSVTRIEDLLQPAAANPAPLRSLNIQIENDGRPVAVIHLEQQVAGMHVAVRGQTPAMSESLRSGLPQLVRSLQDGGIQADFQNRAVAPGESASSAASSMRSGMNDRGGEHSEGHMAGTYSWQHRERQQERNHPRETVQEEDE